MSPRITTQILSTIGLAAMVLLPVQETALARSISSSSGNTTGTTYGASLASDTYRNIWGGPLYSNRQISGSNLGGGTYPGRGISGSSTGRQITGSNSNTGGRQITGSGLGGGTYPGRGISGSSTGRQITGSNNGGRQISGATSGGYGSSLVPGGYQYDPGRNITGNNTGGRQISGSNSGGRQISGSGSGSTSCGYGSSLVPGGYQFCGVDGDRQITGSNSGDRQITGSNSGGRQITGSDTGDRQITGSESNSCGYGSSLVPGGYQYCGDDGDDRDITGSDPDEHDDNEPVYFACREVDTNERIYKKEFTGIDSILITYYDEDGDVIEKGEIGPGVYAQHVFQTEVYDCYEISYSEFLDRINDHDDDDDDDRDDHDDENEISECYDRPYPKDIDDHWSEIYVRRLYDLCIIEGYTDGTFKPEQHVSRAELVKMALYARGIEPDEGCYDNDCGTPFVDLDPWQGQWIRPAYFRDIVDGYDHNHFRPNQSITRAEAVKVVLATYGYEALNVNDSFFNDVHGWSIGWIERAHRFGIVQGIGNGNFDPDRPVTRAEAAKIIAKMMEYWDTHI